MCVCVVVFVSKKLLTHCHTVNTKAKGSRSYHSNKTWPVTDFPKSGDYVLQVAENKTSLYPIFEYFNLHFALRERAKLGRKTANRIASSRVHCRAKYQQ